MQFSERLKAARKNEDLTQDEVAQKLHVLRQTISNWENGKAYPDINSLIKISDFYNLSLDTLLKEDQDMTEHLSKKEFTNKINIGLILIKIVMGILSLSCLYEISYVEDFFMGIFLLIGVILAGILSNYIKYSLKYYGIEEDEFLDDNFYGANKLLKWGSQNVMLIFLFFGSIFMLWTNPKNDKAGYIFYISLSIIIIAFMIKSGIDIKKQSKK
ncbi:helix-turn-helix domain-containing protein [Lactobacillus sp. S2-2]|uniref:helix-turn-helix domain-containing protein n=1 Tax=Lactobacillus sp. S2-2 TaxID=2692917 RepID=UPI001F2444D0|nr:helix-turn-helix transcriptional regulator [Lactobacillus sp. S2-2]MCF6515372.1 helix-turn-helix domain-containing protein [Lactobacillus sp. S2-2]